MMKNVKLLILPAVLVAALGLNSFKKQADKVTIISKPAAEPGWINLLDKNLSQWTNYLSYSHKNGYKGDIPLDENGKEIAPVGYNKNTKNVFSVVTMQGEPVLRVSGEIYGAVISKKEYENYHFKLKVKWGTLKFEPRKYKLKDSGILYHSIGESGADYWRSWMLSQEFQIMEGHMGDYWNQGTSAIDIRAYLSEGKMNSVANAKQPFIGFGSGNLDGFCLRSENFETPNNGWTTIELICYKGSSLHIVNGHVAMVLKNSRYILNGKSVPLAKGKIQLQSEAGEVFYKDIQIKNLNAVPAQYAAYLK